MKFEVWHSEEESDTDEHFISDEWNAADAVKIYSEKYYHKGGYEIMNSGNPVEFKVREVGKPEIQIMVVSVDFAPVFHVISKRI